VPSNSSSFIPTALNDLIGARFKIIPRLPGLAAHGAGDGARRGRRGRRHELRRRSRPPSDWLAERKIRILYAQGAHRIKELPDDPGWADFAVDERSRQILGLLGGGPDIGRSIVAEPGIQPSARPPCAAPSAATMEDAVRRGHAQAQPEHRAVERRRGADHRRGRRRDAVLVEQAKRYAGQKL
jgi:hypothetical protein